MARTRACLRASVASRAPKALPRSYQQLISDPLPADPDAKARAYAERLIEAKARYQLVKAKLRELVCLGGGGDEMDALCDKLQKLRELQWNDFFFAWRCLPCFVKVERVRNKTTLEGVRTEVMTRKLKYGFSADITVIFKQKYINSKEDGVVSIKVNKR